MNQPAILLLFLSMVFIARGEHPLFDAIDRQSKEDVMRALRRDSNIDIQDDRENTPFLWAIEKNSSPDFIKFLINQGFDVNSSNLGGMTPLMTASTHGYDELAELLIFKKANINEQDQQGLTALMWVARSWPLAGVCDASGCNFDATRYEKMLDILLKHGAQVNIRDNEGKTALMHAVENFGFWHPYASENDCAIFKILVKAGADALLKDKEGKTAFDYAIEYPTIYSALAVASGKTHH